MILERTPHGALREAAGAILVAFVLSICGPAFGAEGRDVADCNQDRDHDRKIAGCTRLLASKSESQAARVLVLIARGRGHFRNGDYDLAVADGDEALRLDSRSATALGLRGLAYHHKGDQRRAVADLDAAIALNPKEPVFYMNRGVALASLGALDRAIADCDQAIRLDPKNPGPYVNRANFRKAQGDPVGAAADLAAAVELDPKFAAAYNQRGLLHFALDRFDLAIADFSKAIMLDPNLHEAFGNRAVARGAKRDYNGAIADFTEAIRLAPRDARAYGGRAIVYFYLGSLDRAIADESSRLTLEPRAVDSWLRRGIGYVLTGRHDKAVPDLKRALALAPTDPFVALWTEIAERRAGGRGNLSQSMTKLDMARWPSPIVALFLGRITPAAVRAYTEHDDVATRRRWNCHAHFFTGEWALLQGAAEAAAGQLRLAKMECPPDQLESAYAQAELDAIGRTRSPEASPSGSTKPPPGAIVNQDVDDYLRHRKR